VLEFVANAVAVEELVELNTFVVALAEDADGAGRSLEVQLALTFDDQDRAFGEDTYCLVVDGGPTHYGGVIAYDLSDQTLTIELDDAAQAELAVETGFRVRVAEGSCSLDELRTGLSRALHERRVGGS
jgi:hypothetical protein